MACWQFYKIFPYNVGCCGKCFLGHMGIYIFFLLKYHPWKQFGARVIALMYPKLLYPHMTCRVFTVFTPRSQNVITEPEVSGVSSEVEKSPPFSFCALTLTIPVFRMNTKFFTSVCSWVHVFWGVGIFVSDFLSNSPPLQMVNKKWCF